MDIRNCKKCGNEFDKDDLKIKSLCCNECIKKSRMDRYYNKQKFDSEYMERGKLRNLNRRKNLSEDEKKEQAILRKTKYDNNLELYAERKRKSRVKSKDKISNYNKLWNLANKEYRQTYRKLNAHKETLNAANRRARKKQAMPKWLTEEDLIKMRDIYKECRHTSKQTDIIHHVDHIFPLVGIDSCGLHVPWNLRIITEEENLKKARSLDINLL